MSTPRLIEIPKIEDRRGNLAVIEKEVLPFKMQRIYYLYNVPAGASRGGHAHLGLIQFLVALSGSFDVLIKDGINEEIITLNRPDVGLLIPEGYWRELDNFSAGGVCLVIASAAYDEEEYIRDYDEFLSFKNL